MGIAMVLSYFVFDSVRDAERSIGEVRGLLKLDCIVFRHRPSYKMQVGADVGATMDRMGAQYVGRLPI